MSIKGVVYTRSEWESTKKHWGGKCAYCGGIRAGKKNLTKDHILPASLGGQKVMYNIIPACSKCNSEKSSYLVEEWYRRQDFFNEKRLMEIYRWVTGECYSVCRKKRRGG